MGSPIVSAETVRIWQMIQRDCWGDDRINELVESHEALRACVVALEAALAVVVDDDECVFDHHGMCQTHGPGPIPCQVATARAVLAESTRRSRR